MKIIELAFTAYPITDLKRARAFYEGTLGLVPAKVFGDDKTAWIEYEIGSATLAIGNMSKDWKPSSNGCAVGLEVEDFDAAIHKLLTSGCRFYVQPVETPVCRFAVVADPDGNSLMIHKRKG